MVTNRAIKLCMKLTLYTILLLTFYTLYMRNAIDQFLRRSTTIGYRQEKVEKYIVINSIMSLYCVSAHVFSDA